MQRLVRYLSAVAFVRVRGSAPQGAYSGAIHALALVKVIIEPASQQLNADFKRMRRQQFARNDTRCAEANRGSI